MRLLGADDVITVYFSKLTNSPSVNTSAAVFKLIQFTPWLSMQAQAQVGLSVACSCACCLDGMLVPYCLRAVGSGW